MMTTLPEYSRRVTTFLLAVFLWLHAFFFLNVPSTLFSKYTRALRLTASEAVLFALLLIFSFIAASGFWRTVRSLAYIYFFPFVLLGYAFLFSFRGLRALNRWLKSHAPADQEPIGALVIEQRGTEIASATPVSRPPVCVKQHVNELFRFLLRPFRRFTFLWCFLLVATTHTAIVWLCLVVVLVSLARKVFVILQILLFSPPWFGRIAPAIVTNLNTIFTALAAVTRDAAPTPELKNLWSQLNLWRKVLNFFKNSYLVSRWAWVLGIIVVSLIYTYIAVLFSFAYYGLARVSGVHFSWPDALVTSVFIPFFISDLPKLWAVRLLSGVHCVLVLLVGVGTLVNFLRRKLDAIREAAADLSDRFEDRNIHEKYIILEEKFSAATKS